MTALAASGYYILAGICGYAAIYSLSMGMQQKMQRAQSLFALMCLVLVPFAVSYGASIQSSTQAQFLWAEHLGLTTILVFFLLFPWFIREYTGFGSQTIALCLSGAAILMIILNLYSPYSIQYSSFEGLRKFSLPWGEAVTMGIGSPGVPAVLCVFTLAGILAFAAHASREYHANTPVTHHPGWLSAGGLFMLCVMESVLVRTGQLNFIDIGPFGFLSIVTITSISMSRRSQQQLETSERHFRALVDQSPISMQFLRLDGTTSSVNPAWENLWELPGDVLEGYSILDDKRLEKDGYMALLRRCLQGEAMEIPTILHRPWRDPGSKKTFKDKWVRCHIYPIRDADGNVESLVSTNEDITEEKRAEEAIRLIASGVSATAGEDFFHQLTESLVQLFDADLAYIGVFDDNDPELVNTLSVALHGETIGNFNFSTKDTLCTVIIEKGSITELEGLRAKYPEYQARSNMDIDACIGFLLRGSAGNPLGVIVVAKKEPLECSERAREILDIFAGRAGAELQRLRAEEHIKNLAYRDYLTGLDSRASLHEHLAARLRAARANGEGGALLLVDLDHFKNINDALSHDIGDEVLKAVSRRLKEVVGNRAFTARLGGDEFVAVIDTGSADEEFARKNAQETAEQLMAKLVSPLYVEQRAFNLGASIGIVLFPENGETEVDVLRHADMALYRAKNLGRGNIQFYNPGMQELAAQRLQLEEGLRRAVANGELELYFQPQVDANEQAIGAEALLRWKHPELGEIPPYIFIPVAEEAGLIHSIGQWVLEKACERFLEWQRGGIPFSGHISVNVSPWQFNRPDFVDQIEETLGKLSIDPNRIMLELTESALLYDLEEAVERLHALRELGLGVALDDFGTGYSSLAYLRDLPLDRIKIDKSFVNEMLGAGEHPLLESMITIGQHMRLPVVAEGVETVEQRDTLIRLGCRRFQGYLFCRPLPERDFLTWLRNNIEKCGPVRSYSL